MKDSQKLIKEGWRYRSMEGRLVNNEFPSPFEGEGCFQLEAESRKLENRGEGLIEGKKIRGLEDKPFNNSNIAEISQQPQTDTDLTSYRLNVLSSNNGYTSTHPDLYTSKKAFTLAEVLIILAIVGVVAAMTLPTVINKIQDQILISQGKKAYSNLSNVLNKMKADNGVDNFAMVVEGKTIGQIADEFTSYYKTLKLCNSVSEGCGSVYNVKLKKNKEKTEQFRYPRLITVDSSTFFFRQVKNGGVDCTGYPGTTGLDAERCFDIIIDVNGEYKGPNQYGADVHQISVYKNNVYFSSGNYGSIKDIFLKTNELDYTK